VPLLGDEARIEEYAQVLFLSNEFVFVD